MTSHKLVLLLFCVEDQMQDVITPQINILACIHVALCCVSVRSAAPDLRKLNEDGELWLVNQGLKETIRFNSVFEHDTFAFFHGKGCDPLVFFAHVSLSHFISLTSVGLF